MPRLERVQDDRRRGAFDPQLGVPREGRDPLDPRDGSLAVQVRRERDDPVAVVVGEAEEEGVRHDRPPQGVRDVGAADGLDDLVLASREDVLDVGPAEDQHGAQSSSSQRWKTSPKCSSTQASE